MFILAQKAKLDKTIRMKKILLLISLLSVVFTSATAGEATHSKVLWATGELKGLNIHASISWLIDAKPCPSNLKPYYKLSAKPATNHLEDTDNIHINVAYVDADNLTHKLYIRFNKAYVHTKNGDQPIDIRYWIYCGKP